MYSLAPAWIAATAARASVCVPQATSGTWMCSASRRSTRSRMSSATSTISRSAPLPERSTAIAWSVLSAWVTVAPLSIAILVAVVSWPLRVPTIRRRIVGLRLFWLRSSICEWRMASSDERKGGRSPFAARYSPRGASSPLRLDDFRHRHAELVLDQDDLAARDQAVVDVDVDGFADLAIELEHGAGTDIEKLAHLHVSAAEHGRDLHRNVEHRFEVGRTVRARLGRGRRDRLRIPRDDVVAGEAGEWDLVVVGHVHLSRKVTASSAPAANRCSGRPHRRSQPRSWRGRA